MTWSWNEMTVNLHDKPVMESSADYIIFYKSEQLLKTRSLLLTLALTFKRMSQKTMLPLFYNETQISGGYSAKLKIHTVCLIRASA